MGFPESVYQTLPIHILYDFLDERHSDDPVLYIPLFTIILRCKARRLLGKPLSSTDICVAQNQQLLMKSLNNH